MISCEEFESLFNVVDNSETQEHLRKCPHCRQFSAEIAALRQNIASISRESTPIDFEIRLWKRIESISEEKSNSRKAIPKALAFASGLALVMVAGFLYQGIQNDSQQSLAEYIEIEKMETLTTANDSTNMDSSKTNPWGDYIPMETVSSQK